MNHSGKPLQVLAPNFCLFSVKATNITSFKKVTILYRMKCFKLFKLFKTKKSDSEERFVACSISDK